MTAALVALRSLARPSRKVLVSHGWTRIILGQHDETDDTDFASRFALVPPGCVHSASRVLFLRMATRVYDACSVNFVESVGDNKRNLDGVIPSVERDPAQVSSPKFAESTAGLLFP